MPVLRFRACLFLTVLGSVAGAAFAQIGTAVGRTVIADGSGGLPQVLEPDDYFGSALAALGDIDGDGVGDLAVGAPDEQWPPTNEDSVWILFLRPDGTVRSAQQLSEGVGGFSDPLALSFGWSVGGAGDVDGDGVPDLAAGVGAMDGGVWKGALWILFLKRDGTVRAQQRISQTAGNFGGVLPERAGFGNAVTALGDLDHDGIQELAVGAPGQGPGAIWILHLDRNGMVRSQSVIDASEPALAGLLATRDHFGGALAALGDIDGDGDVDLVSAGPKGQIDGKVWVLRLAPDQSVEAARVIRRTDVLPDVRSPYYPSAIAAVPDLDGDGIKELAISAYDFRLFGAVAPVRLASDGSVRRSALMARNTGGLGDFPEIDFGYAVASPGDLDGDGVPELAVGAPEANDERGSVWVLHLDTSPVRNGTGVNPVVLTTPGEPVLGHPWKVELDCAGHAPGVAIVIAASAPISGRLTPAGELLIDLATPRIFTFRAPHSGQGVTFGAQVPNDIALFDLVLHVQGMCTGAPGPQLSNALDLIVVR